MAETVPLEDRLEELLDQETFPPPEEFAEHADVTDEAIYEQADEDYEAFWAEQADALRLVRRSASTVLDWSDPPFAKWFAGGKLNVVRQLPRPPRRGRQRRPRRLPLARRGGRGARTSPTPTSTATCRSSPTR